MKKLLLSITALCLTLIIQAQSNPVDELFNKYSEREGFTVVSMSGRMFSMFSEMDSDNKDADNVISRLKSIRILSVEDSLLNKNLNFYSELGKKLDFSVYEELMVVKEGRDITKFLIKQKGNLISELLVITGGPGGNSLISIRGDFNLKNISDLSKNIGIEELGALENVDKK
ncbi:MAG TPA: DUF4252 domain-containing protein [Bacteroidales bacterium]|nr:DUF4252 domain-containing protein [Bacteroidales bacterium]